MDKAKDLESRVTALEDVEAIKKLKAKYWRSVSGKHWDELAECFSENAEAYFETAKKMYTGKAAIMNYLRENSFVGKESVIGMPHGHNPEITLTSENTAEGIWQLMRYTIDKQTEKRKLLAAFYNDNYVKENGQWRLKSYKTTNIFVEEWSKNN